MVNAAGADFKMMKGGEIIVPKLPSMKITDLAKAIDQDKKTKIIGVRPGEKTHEILCPSDDSRLTIEFKEHYIIIPSINFEINKKKFKRNNLKETGKFVNPNFEATCVKK